MNNLGQKILVDGVFFQTDNTSGIARTWREILKLWGKSALSERLVFLSRGVVPAEAAGLAILECPSFDPNAWMQDRFVVEEACSATSAGLFISTYYTHPVKTRSLLLVHDMIPERLGFDLTRAVWRQKQSAIHYAAGYACVSRNTEADLKAYFPHISPKPTILAPNGVSPEFKPASAQEREQFLRVFVGPKLGARPYIIFPGLVSGYKNGALLLEALKRIDCTQLGILFTIETPEIRQFREIPGLAVHCERLNDLGLRLAYSCALALVYPSFYEGFGLPVLEAMACGCPVICANTSALPEVAGDAAILIDPSVPDQLSSALLDLSRGARRDEMIVRGLGHASEFKWRTCADQIAALALRLADTDCEPADDRSAGSRLSLPPHKTYQVGQFELALPAEHKLDLYQMRFRLYDRALRGIARSVKRKYPDASAVDIGANIGDSAALLCTASDMPVLCVEGFPPFLEFLRVNVGVLPNSVEVEACLIGSGASEVAASDLTSDGATATLASRSDDAHRTAEPRILVRTLSEVLSRHPRFATPRLLKLDTDGCDFEIICSAWPVIEAHLPVVYFEYDPTFHKSGLTQAAAAVEVLIRAGYRHFLVYDNYGNLLRRVGDDPAGEFRKIGTYLMSHFLFGRQIHYVDVCAFASADQDLADEIEAEHMTSIDAAISGAGWKL